MKKHTRILSLLLLLCMLIATLPITAISAFASELGKQVATDATVDIKNNLSDYIQVDTTYYEDDGYIGIPYEVTVYYDTSKGDIVPGIGGTVIVMYVVNTNTERVGTDSDTEIITSMLDRGYVVAVLDYKNNEKATTPNLDYSTQTLRNDMRDGKYFTDSTVFPAGTYYENHLVPAGYDISLSHVYFEIDKHGVDGDMEKIVETWNYDFRAIKGDRIVKWVDGSGNRKNTQKGVDGSSPVWYADAAGTVVDQTNGQYIKITHTWAKKIQDCVKADGTPIDLNLYMHVMYPTNPENEVPVLVYSSASEHLASSYSQTSITKHHFVGAMFRGYATATYDYDYVPMARDDHYGYFAGDYDHAMSGINSSYALGGYDRGLYNTAAFRYLRYLSYTEPEIYRFDDEAMGLFGLSKGGTQTFMGTASLRESMSLSDMGEGATIVDLEAYIDNKIEEIYPGYIVVMDPECIVTEPTGKADTYYTYDGSTRYGNGKTEDIYFDGYVIDGGEKQPWLTYTDENGEVREIMSGAQIVHSNVSATLAQPWEGHAPVVTTSNFGDSYGGAYDTHNYLPNVFRIYDIPSLYYEIPAAHALIGGIDCNYGVDTYVAFWKFFDYYLKNEAVSVSHTDAINGDVNVSTTDGILIKFLGEVTAEEIAKITFVDGNGNVAKGEWVSSCGNTEWTFYPVALNGGATYTVTVPATMKGANGVAMGADYIFTFRTEAETADIFDMSNNVTLSETNGTVFSFTVPEKLDNANKIYLRFKVTNNAANIADIYSANDAGTAVAKLGSVNLKGEGYYEYDVTDYVMKGNAGETVKFLVKAQKAASVSTVYTHDFDTMNGIYANGRRSLVTEVEGEAVTALKYQSIYYTEKEGHGISGGYSSWYPVMVTNSQIINGGAPVTEADYGRTFMITLRVYDTATRPLQLWFNDCIDRANQRVDYSYTRTMAHTVAGEWMEITVPYTVYEMDYGVMSQVKQLKVIGYSTGSSEMPLYYDKLTVTEIVTDIELASAELVYRSVGDKEYKAPVSENRFEVGGDEYATLWDALSATNDSDKTVIKLLGDYDATDTRTIPERTTLTIDLNGYIIRLSDASLLNLSSDSATKVSLTVKNGTVIVSDHPIISYLGASATGDGKAYELNFEDLYIDTEKGGSSFNVITSGDSPSGASITQNVSVKNCIIDINRKHLPLYSPITVFPSNGVNLSSDYTVTCGEIITSRTNRLAFYDDNRDVVFMADDNGNYTEIKVSASQSVLDALTVVADKGYCYYLFDGEADGLTSYALTSAKYSTPYGIIPDDKSPEEYPFAIFVDGKLVGLYSRFSHGNDSVTDNALYGALTYIRGEHNSDVQIYLRRDYSMADGGDTNFNNFSQIGGNVTVDLNTHTLTLSSFTLFNCYAKAGWDKASGKNFIYDTRFTITGGTINAGKNTLITYASSVTTSTDYNKEKLFDISFNGTKIITSGALVKNSTNVNTRYGALLDLKFNDCELDISGITSATTLFTASDSLKMNDLAVSINGGNITASELSYVTMLSGDIEDSVVYGANEDGEYVTLTMPSEVKLSTFGGKNDAGAYVQFGNGVSDGTNTVYSLKESKNITKYGAIPDEYADADAYPFIVFQNGLFVGAFDRFIENVDSNGVNSAMEQAKALLVGNDGSATVYILMRRSYTYVSGENGEYYNLAVLGGNLIIDMDGYTLTGRSGVSMFKVTAKNAYVSGKGDFVTTTNIKFTNGTIESYDALIRYDTTKGATFSKLSGDKITNFVFDKVNIVFKSNATISLGVLAAPLASPTNNTKNAFFNAMFNDCSIDLTALGSTSLMLVNGLDGNNLNNVNVVINGGEILANNAAAITLGTFNENDGVNADSILFGKGETGYTEIIATSGNAPTYAVPTDNGISYFAKDILATSGVVCSLGEMTKYGVIPYKYDTASYPLVVFCNGELVGLYNAWSQDNKASALYHVKNLLTGKNSASKSATILLRTDYTTTSGVDAWYNNLTHICGKLTVDLGGHTFTASYTNMFTAIAKTSDNTVWDTVIVIENGKIVTSGANVVNAQSGVSATQVNNYTRNKIFDFTFNNVEFILTSAKSLINTVDTASNNCGSTFNYTFNNCTFNVSGASNSAAIFDGLDSTGLNVANITVNGGSIVGYKAMLKIFTSDAGDSIVFGKYNGKYITLIGTSVPTDTFDTAEGYKAVFSKVEGSETDYTLVRIFVTSITLPADGESYTYKVGYSDGTYREFTVTEGYKNGLATLNGYIVSLEGNIGVKSFMNIPAFANTDKLYVKFTVDGVETVQYFSVAENNASYGYGFKGMVAAAQMTSDIKIELCYDGIVLLTDTISVAGYAKTILDNEDNLAEYTKAQPVVKAMLNYGAAAQTQFGINLDKPANSIVSDVTVGDNKDAINAAAKSTKGKNIAGVTYKSTTLGLESETALYHFFNVTDTDIANYTVTGADEVTIIGDVLRVKIAGIEAANLSTEYEVSVTYGGNTITFSANAMAYAKAVVNSDSVSAELKTLMNALYEYNVAMVEYNG